MNSRNFQTNQQIRTRQNYFAAASVPGHFNPMRNLPSGGENFGLQPGLTQQWGAPPNTQERCNQMDGQPHGMGPPPMFSRQRFNNGPERVMAQEMSAPFYQMQNNFIPNRGPQFPQNNYNSGPVEEPPFNQRQFNPSPERDSSFFGGQYNRSQDSGLGFPREERNRGPERGPEFDQRRFNDSPPQFNTVRYSPSPERSMRRMSPPHLRGPPQEMNPESTYETPEQYGLGENNASGPPPINRNSGGTWRTMENPSKRKKVIPDYPKRGEPGALDDPRRKTLCGSRTKWYLRYLRQGIDPDEALRMAKEPKQPAAGGIPPAKRPHIEQPPAQPNPKRVRIDDADRATTSRSPEAAATQPGKFKVSLMPVGFPKERLTHQEKLDLEEAILLEVAMSGSSAGAPLRFSDISFKPGFLQLECSNKASADWLMRAGSHLSSYNGRQVEPKMSGPKDPEHRKYLMTVFLPRSVDKSNEFLLGLLKSQNQYNTDLWKLVSRKDQGSGALLVLVVDKASAVDIAANGHTIFYRYGTVPVRGLPKKKLLSSKNPNSSPANGNATQAVDPNAAPDESIEQIYQESESPICIDLESDNEPQALQ